MHENFIYCMKMKFPFRKMKFCLINIIRGFFSFLRNIHEKLNCALFVIIE